MLCVTPSLGLALPYVGLNPVSGAMFREKAELVEMEVLSGNQNAVTKLGCVTGGRAKLIDEGHL